MNDEILNLVEVAVDRDPREAPFGIYSGGSFVMDEIRAFSWFESLEALAAYLLDVEPLIYDLDDADELAAYKAKISPMLEKLKANGFNEALREEMNEALKEILVIDWWGNFTELSEGKTEFSKNHISNFVDVEDHNNMEIQPDQIDNFVKYLRNCAC